MTAIVIGGPYESWKNPKELKPGLLLTKTWAAPLVHGATPIWSERTRGYWERIEQRFGIVVTNRADAFDEVTETITTYAAVLAILKGDRYPYRGQQGETRH